MCAVLQHASVYLGLRTSFASFRGLSCYFYLANKNIYYVFPCVHTEATPMVTLCHFVGTPSHGDEVQAAYASLLEEVLGDFGRSGCSADTLRLHWELLTTQSKSGGCSWPGVGS